MNVNGGATLVRDKLQHGALPRERPVKAYGGPGLGKVCVACAERIDPPKFQYESEMRSGETFYFCRECYFAWLNEVDGGGPNATSRPPVGQ